MKSQRSMLYALGFVFVIAFVVIYASKKTTVLNSNSANNTNSGALTETTNPDGSKSSGETGLSGNPQDTGADLIEKANTAEPYSSSGARANTETTTDSKQITRSAEAARIQQIEIEKNKELNEKNVKLIQEQMRQEEIASLKNSIVNDEKLLKEIEAQGTGADDYRYIESNLKKRRARLKELTQK
jgi:hypothetical protein